MMWKLMIMAGYGVPVMLAATGARADPYGAGYGGSHMWGGGFGWFFGPLTMILVLVAIVAAIVVMVRWLDGSRLGSYRDDPLPGSGRTTPLDILKERFAKGEIDKKEFEDRRKALEA